MILNFNSISKLKTKSRFITGFSERFFFCRLQYVSTTRGMTRLNLRSQEFENSNCFGSTNDLIAFECDTKQFRLHNF